MARAWEELAANGVPLLDRVPAGLSHVIVHPAAPGYDIEAITRSAPQRIADYRMILDPALKACVAEQGVHLIGYRQLRDLMRGSCR